MLTALSFFVTMIDNKLTENMQAWLAESAHDRESLMRGAEMVLKLTRNMSMYQTIIRRPEKFESKIRYELQKFLPMRLEQMTTQDVKALSAELIPEVKKAVDEEATLSDSDENIDNDTFLPAASGIRPDHDSLPEDVQSVWSDNKERWLKIKQLYNTLLAIEQPCDRYEYLKQLKELWYTYKRELERYDNYVAPEAGETADDAAPSPVDIAKDIANARAYITKNVDKLIELRNESLSSDDATKALDDYNKLLVKMQQRVDTLNSNNAPVGDDLKAKLNEAGLSLPSAE